MTDLIGAITYVFSTEVFSHAHMQGEEFSALQHFVQLVTDLIPFPSPLYNAMDSLAKTLHNTDQIIIEKVQTTLRESGLDVEKNPSKWANCQGSQPGRRGYPCSLWQLFHTLTVQAYEKSLKNGKSNENCLDKKSGVLRGIFGYVRYFFSCAECRDNFMREADSLLAQTEGLPEKNGVLWLWRIHNGVNLRLAGDITEDENFPKIQFPSVEQCARCRDPITGQWNDEEVVKFLRNFYSFTKVGGQNTVGLEAGLNVRSPIQREEVLFEMDKLATFEGNSRQSLRNGKFLLVAILCVAFVSLGVRQFVKWRSKGGRYDFPYSKARVKSM